MKKIEQYIDHTALKPNVTREQIIELCVEAKKYEFASVCVNPTWVSVAKEYLQGTSVAVCTVIGFPLGATTPEVKAFETNNALENGATEIDMVINVGALIDGDTELVGRDIRAVVDATSGRGLVKVIIETSLLTEEQKRVACEISVEAGCDFVKTSTGFSGGGATVEDIRLMRSVVGEKIGVKASGGVKNVTDANAMLEAGATRIGTSSGVSIAKKVDKFEDGAY